MGFSLHQRQRHPNFLYGISPFFPFNFFFWLYTSIVYIQILFLFFGITSIFQGGLFPVFVIMGVNSVKWVTFVSDPRCGDMWPGGNVIIVTG